MTRFHVRVVGVEDLSEIEGSWTAEDYVSLLERMDFGDISGLSADELREMCLLSLQDREPAEAAALLLEHRLGDELGKGQIRNVSHDMLDEKLWEEYADMPLHERLFHVGSLLYRAFPEVPEPDAVSVRLEIRVADEHGEQILAGPLDEAFVVRLVAAGMPDSTRLNRLFHPAIADDEAPFPEAESILWIVLREPVDARNVRLHVIGSGCWLDPLRQTRSFEHAAR